MMRRRWVGGCAVLLVCGLGACDAGEKPAQGPTASSLGAGVQVERELPKSVEPITVSGTLDGVDLDVTLGPVAATGDAAVLPIEVARRAGDGTVNLTARWSDYAEDVHVPDRILLIDPDAPDDLVALSAAATKDGTHLGTGEYTTLRPEDTSAQFDVVFPAPTTPTVNVLVPGIGYVRDVPVLPADKAAGVTALSTYVKDPTALILPRAALTGYVEDASGSQAWTGGQVELSLNSDLLFATGSAELTADADSVLAGVAEQLAAAGSGGLEVVGHTDDVGDEAANQQLSEQRAQAVADRLATLTDLSAFDVSVAGRGESEPAVDDTTDEARAANRRVTLEFTAPTEIVITGTDADAPVATGPVATGEAGVQVANQFSSVGASVTLSVTAGQIHRVDGLLIGQLHLRNDSAEEATIVDAVSRSEVPDFGFSTSSANAGGVALLIGDRRVYPVSFPLDPGIEELSEWSWVADPEIAHLAPGATYTATVVWPDIDGDVATIDVPPRVSHGGLHTPFRLTDVPIVDG